MKNNLIKAKMVCTKPNNEKPNWKQNIVYFIIMYSFSSCKSLNLVHI